ncbi:Aldo/keto reductase [Schizopora paradoxa]|uniref:Aldo/keto reductase n=1 Tax=Schizopora paradoxa TaxID=27342 RepID=A0A0H2RY04_9AGAM|nr:Aldo/keto reductase [Schizopora paradoxa]
MPAHTSVKLNTGAEMPVLGLGTWQSKPEQVRGAVQYALEIGYRHIDTAAAYGNEKEVGEGIKLSGVPREQIFLTTKLPNEKHKQAEEALEESLKALDTTYLDLWLMHWPAPMIGGKADKTHDWIDTWKSMEELYKKYPEKLKAIGVSNCSVDFLERLLPQATVIPAVNQVELHPSCTQHDVVEYCTKRGIVLTAYSPLGSEGSPLLSNHTVKKIAHKHNVQPATVLISYAANRPNLTVLPKSVTKERIAANFKVIDLTDEDLKELHKIDETEHFRACGPEWTGWGHLGFPDFKFLAK